MILYVINIIKSNLVNPIQNENEPNSVSQNQNNSNLNINNNTFQNNFSNLNLNLIPSQDIINDNEEEDSSMNEINEDEELDNQFETKINEIYNNISVIIENEKNKIKTKRDIIQKARNDFNQFKKIELEKLELKKKELKNLFQLKNNKKENDILDLNIGGTHQITTSRNTLIKYKNSALATLFSGEKELPKYNGKIFIDRDGESFINLINFLRTGKFPVLKNDIEESKFFTELEFWKIPLSDGSKNKII